MGFDWLLLAQHDALNLPGSRITQRRSLEACGAQPVGHDPFEGLGPFHWGHISDVYIVMPKSSKITVRK